MPEQCDICKVEAAPGEEFVIEGLWSSRKKRYCPRCRQKYTNKVSVVMFAGTLFVAFLGGLHAVIQNESLLDSAPVRIALFFCFQCLTVFPHELGHAVVGKWLGFKNIRVLVGVGKTLFTFHFLGCQWLINSLPIGGLTIPGSYPDSASFRQKIILFVAAGPTVNVILGAITLFVGGREVWTLLPHTLPGLFFWANLFVLVVNLIPQTIPSAQGPLRSDGLLILDTVFPRKRKVSDEAETVPLWELTLYRLLKTVVVMLLGAATLLPILIFIFIFNVAPTAQSVAGYVALAIFALGLMVTSGYFTWRVLKQPIARIRKSSVAIPVAQRSNNQFISHSRFDLASKEWHEFAAAVFRKDWAGATQLAKAALPEQPDDCFVLFYEALKLVAEGNPSGGEQMLGRLKSVMPLSATAAHAQILLHELRCAVVRQDYESARQRCMEFLSGQALLDEKVFVADHLACVAIYEDFAGFLPVAEQIIRRAIELSPSSITLQGTLGGILVELGQDPEAEKLLRNCLNESAALHDKGISELYLGMIEANRGQLKSARTMLKRAMVFHPEEWLLKKAKQKLEQLSPHTL